jgi:hypothetical protein
MRYRRLAAGTAAAIAALAFATTANVATTASAATSTPAAHTATPKLDHVFLIMEENNGFSDVIGNKAAPNLNYLANTFGLETNYYGLTTASSEPNYVGLLGGSMYNVTTDDAYWKNKIAAPSLISQLDHAGVSWKAYLQSSPHAGYQGICYPEKCNGAPDNDPLYVSKHDVIQNFTTSWNPHDWSRQVPMTQLAADLTGADLTGNKVPRFSYVIPDECHDMHGDPPYCLDSGNIGDPQNQHLVAQSDAYLGQLVKTITQAKFWAKSNNAIVVTFDNGDNTKGCCDASPGGGQVATVVITSHGPRHVTDSTPANHYSLLQTIEDTFGLGCLKATCDTTNVKPLSSLLTITGSKPIATLVKPELTWPTPTPSQPAEPLGTTSVTKTANGWTVQQTQTLGAADNSPGAIAGSSGNDIWAVGNYLPDAAGSNVDATISFAEHYNGTKWSVVRTPNAGPNFNTLFAITVSKSADSEGKAWAVGVRLNSAYQNRALIEYWDGTKWSLQSAPQPGSQRDILFAASSTSTRDVWAVGDQQDAKGVFRTLVEHYDGTKWTAVPAPNPGNAGDHFYAVDAVSPTDAWAVGQRLSTNGSPDQGLVEHWDGRHWSVADIPASEANVMLTGVAVANGHVWGAGEADTPTGGGRALVLEGTNGHWSAAHLPAIPSDWTNLWSLTAVNGTVYAAGTFWDMTTDLNDLLVLRESGGTWTIDAAPAAGSGNNIAGGIATVAGHAWIAGTYTNGPYGRIPLIEVH